MEKESSSIREDDQKIINDVGLEVVNLFAEKGVDIKQMLCIVGTVAASVAYTASRGDKKLREKAVELITAVANTVLDDIPDDQKTAEEAMVKISRGKAFE